MDLCTRQGNNWRRSARGVWPLVIACLLVACAAEKRSEPHRSRSIITDVILTVDNRTADAMVIYVASGGWSDSLGQVARRSARSFSLPSEAGDSMKALQLEARRDRTTPGLRSPPFRVSSGRQAIWIVERAAAGSVTLR